MIEFLDMMSVNRRHYKFVYKYFEVLNHMQSMCKLQCKPFSIFSPLTSKLSLDLHARNKPQIQTW